MTIETLIHDTLRDIRLRFYGDRTREYCRDRQALTKAIARYGFACDTRGWDLEPEYIQRDIIALLKQIQQQGGAKGYLPVYLEGAIDRHVRLRAEQIQDAAHKLDGRVARTISGVRVAPETRLNTTETLAALYKSLRKPRRKPNTPRPAQPQLDLL
jgi:hypothetical protein